MRPINPKKSPCRQNDRNLSECKLLDAAQEMFMRLGFDASTTRMIASSAGVNLALISKYFGSKEGLLLSLLERRGDKKVVCASAYPVQADLVSELKSFFHHALELHCTLGAVMMKIVISKSLTDENFRTQVKKRLVRDNKHFLDRLEDLKKAGKIRADADVAQLEDELQGYFRSQIFFGAILFGDEREKITKKLEKFAETLGRAYT